MYLLQFLNNCFKNFSILSLMNFKQFVENIFFNYFNDLFFRILYVVVVTYSIHDIMINYLKLAQNL